jgi:FlaA1/EpsC-like NDP-sugar epimerase
MEAIITLVIYLISIIGSFFYFKVYHHEIKYGGIEVYKLLAKVSTLSLIFLFLITFILNKVNEFHFSFQTSLLSWIIIVFGVFCSRLLVPIFQENKEKINNKGKRTLIVGAGNAGILVLHEIRKSNDSPLNPIAFIDDDLDKLNMMILGIPVVGTKEDIHSIVKQYSIEMIIIAMPSAQKTEITKIVNICNENNVDVRILPRINDIINGRITLNMLREVKIEDLLDRPAIELDLHGIAEYVTNKTVLVTGAGGSIGSEICRQISSFQPEKLLLIGHGENSLYLIENELKKSFPHLKFEAIIADIQDRQRIENIFETYSPNIIFHAAAHKHVPLMEFNPTEAIKNNIFGTKNVAECAHKYQAEQFVFISTDKAVNPTSVMGVTKRVAELIIQSLNLISNTNFVAVRFGNVLGSRGSVIPLFKQQIKEGGPVTVTHPEMTRYFMTIPEAVQLVIQAGAFAKGGEIFILDMGKPVKIADLARNLIILSGLTPDKDIMIEYTGIRPGEKLYEELLTSEEGSMASKHQLIFVAKPTDLSNLPLTSFLNQLDQLIHQKEKQATIHEIKFLLKQIVPTYQVDVQPSKE